jgi:hypothetical protein
MEIAASITYTKEADLAVKKEKVKIRQRRINFQV